jgi:hypothetical protein
MAAGGMMHPQADAEAGYEQALAGMFDASAWTLSHGLVLVGLVVLAVSAATLVRGLGRGWSRGARVAGWAVAAAAVLAAIESVPHLLAASEADALRGGESTPLTDVHALLQIVSTPALGLSVAAFALISARDRLLANGRIAAVVAVVGGVAFALAGPLMALTEDPALSPLFAGSAGLAVWFVLAGARTSRRLRGETTARPLDLAAAR